MHPDCLVLITLWSNCQCPWLLPGSLGFEALPVPLHLATWAMYYTNQSVSVFKLCIVMLCIFFVSPYFAFCYNRQQRTDGWTTFQIQHETCTHHSFAVGFKYPCINSLWAPRWASTSFPQHTLLFHWLTFIVCEKCAPVLHSIARPLLIVRMMRCLLHTSPQWLNV